MAHTLVAVLAGEVGWDEQVGHFTYHETVVAASSDFEVTRVEAVARRSS